MITIAPSEDYALLTAMATHPNVYNRMADDFCPAREDFKVGVASRAIFLLATVDGAPSGFWMLQQHSEVLLEIHTCLLPRIWGPVALDAARAVLRWIWDNTKCVRLITSVPAFNRSALHFAKAAGLVEYGVNPMAYQKNHKLHDIIMLGVSRCR